VRRSPILSPLSARARIVAIAFALVLAFGAGLAGESAWAQPAADPLFDADAEEAEAPSGYPDPIESVNRVTFAVNGHVDDWVFDPFTKVYRFLLPAPVRRAVRRVLLNLDAPVTFVNDILQLEPTDAGVTVARFVLNTTVGVVGIFDVAASLGGLPGHASDFGQTLALSGVGSGPYLVFPVLGPTTVRDGTGYLVDFFFRPTTYLLTPGGAVFLSGFAESGSELLATTIFEGSTQFASGLSLRDASGEAMDALEASSLDYYASLRNAFYQNREATIWRRGPDHGPLARVRALFGARALGPAGGEVADLPADHGDERLEPVALEHRSVVRPSQR
jgi:phospholipid-binding lipoprotein MlaA